MPEIERVRLAAAARQGQVAHSLNPPYAWRETRGRCSRRSSSGEALPVLLARRRPRAAASTFVASCSCQSAKQKSARCENRSCRRAAGCASFVSGRAQLAALSGDAAERCDGGCGHETTFLTGRCGRARPRRPRWYHRTTSASVNHWKSALDTRGSGDSAGALLNTGTSPTGNSSIAVAKPEPRNQASVPELRALEFFDLNKDPIVCPKCRGRQFQGAPQERAGKPRLKKKRTPARLRRRPASRWCRSMRSRRASGKKAEPVVDDIDVERGR